MPDFVGTSARDTLNGSAGADVLSGRDGSDSVFGGAGNDTIYGHSTGDLTAGSELIDALRVASGLSNPLFAASPPGDPDRLFIVEQHTRPHPHPRPGLGPAERRPASWTCPTTPWPAGGEQGLLGLAFHPNYASERPLLREPDQCGGRHRGARVPARRRQPRRRRVWPPDPRLRPAVRQSQRRLDELRPRRLPLHRLGRRRFGRRPAEQRPEHGQPAG